MNLHSSFETKVLAAFAAAVLVVTALAAATWKVSHDADEASHLVAHTHEVLNSLARARGDTLLIELSTQNFRLTGDPARLVERDAAVAAREAALSRIGELTADNASQQARWTQLRKVVDERLAISKRATQLRQTESPEAAYAYVASAPVRETRERLFRLFREMDEEEQRLLKKRAAEQLRTSQITLSAGTLVALMLAMLLAATYILIRRQLRETEASRRALAENEKNLSTTLHSIGDAVLATDTAGRITRMNPVAERLTGWLAAEAQGRPVEEVFRIVNEETRAPAVAQVLAAGEIRGLANHSLLIARDGSEHPVTNSAAPISDAAGGVSGVVLVFRDVTKERQAEQALHHLNETLEQANRAKSDFLANMSHELRTPLNAIIGFSEMLKDGLLGELDAKQRGFIADIYDAGIHLLSLINDILDLSKVEAGMLQLELDAADVAALLIASPLIVKEKALAHRIRLDTQIDPALGAMLADERKLKQIVYNLLSNAVKFTPEGGAVSLRARRCTRAEVAFDGSMPARLIALPPGDDLEFIAITVEDTGVGIAEELLPKLFEPFMQVDSSAARRQGGTGLGLSLVRRLAELHGGAVGVASRPGIGSRFCVWLPYRVAAPTTQARQTAREASAPSAPSTPLALVIEDDDRMADLIMSQLRAEGFDAIRAATAEEGLVRAAKHQPQLITLDIFLPAMDGWEFMRRLKAEPKLADTPVVIITVSADLDRGLALGARRVLHKPFAREELVAALSGLVEARPNGAPARVLVVDDNVQAVELVAAMLETEGYRVLRAYGGAEAIEAARSARPDLVILDLMMPQVSGFEVARALRESEHTARIPILVLTAKDLSAEDHARLKDNVSATLAKSSFSRAELLTELRRAIASRKPD